MLVKIAPDLDAIQFGEICRAVMELRLQTESSRPTPRLRAKKLVCADDHPGGLSGQPLKALARARNPRLSTAHTEGQLPIIGVGGVAGADDAYGHLCAGASLVELYTGLIYEGPGLPSAIKQGLMDLMRRDGHNSIKQVIGRSAR